MKSLKLLLVCTLALSAVSPLLAKKEGKRTFWQKHKGKIKAGIAIAAITGITIGLAYHGNKTKGAVDNAGITDDIDYVYAIAIVGLLGPLGKTNMDFILSMARDSGIISNNFYIYVREGDIGKALCFYWGGNEMTCTLKEVGQAIRQEAREVKGWFSDNFDALKKHIAGWVKLP